MEYSNSLGLTTIIKNIAAHFVKLASLEAALARKSLAQVVMLILAAGILLTTTWGSLVGILLLYLNSLHLTWLLSLYIVAGINFFLLVLVIFGIMQVKDNLFFEATSRQIFRIFASKEGE